MATIYDTLRGPDLDPVPVELWTHQGERLGKIGSFESMSFSVSGRPGRSSTATLEVQLTDLTAQLLPCDGAVLVVAHYNGMTLVYTPVTAEARNVTGDASVAVLTVQCTGGWAFLEGAVTVPELADEDPAMAMPRETFELTGDLESVVKKLIDAGRDRVNYPLITVPSSGRGPTVTATGAWETVGEHVESLLIGTNYILTFTGWVPGEPQPINEYILTRPCYVVDLKPYTPQPGLVWSYLGGEVSSWSVTRKRASATRAVVHNGAEDVLEREVIHVQGVEPPSVWGIREALVRHSISKDLDLSPDVRYAEMEAAALGTLAERGPAVEVTAMIESPVGWEFGVDGVTPRQYMVGDMATVDLPVLGEVRQVVTDVEVTITPSALTVTPTVGTPDTMAVTTYDALASVDKRLTRLERKG